MKKIIDYSILLLGIIFIIIPQVMRKYILEIKDWIMGEK
jgi:hypothetical protein